jgi:hypothetical protein
MTLRDMVLRVRDCWWPLAAWLILLTSFVLVRRPGVVIVGLGLVVALLLVGYLAWRHDRDGRLGAQGWTLWAALGVALLWGGTPMYERHDYVVCALLLFLGVGALLLAWLRVRHVGAAAHES